MEEAADSPEQPAAGKAKAKKMGRVSKGKAKPTADGRKGR